MTTISKEDVARSIPILRKQIEDECRSWNREDGIITLLCLDDAYDNLLHALIYNLTIAPGSEQVPDPKKAGYIIHLTNRFRLIRIVLDLVANLGKEGYRTISRVPTFEVSIGPSDEDLKAMMISRGKLRPQDAYIGGGARLMGSIFVAWVVRVLDGRDTIEQKVADGLLRLIDLVNRLLTHSSAVQMGRSLRTASNVSFPMINHPSSVTPERVMAAEDLGPRRLWNSSWSPAEWMSEFGPAMQETMASIHLRIDSPASRQARKKEKDELFKGYEKFLGFSDLFFLTYGFTIGDFGRVTDALEEMALSRSHHLYNDLYPKAVRNAAKISEVPSNIVTKIMQTLTWQSGTLTRHFPIIKLNVTYAFTLIGIRRAVHSRLQGAFLEYDNNLKGEAFERSCRELASTCRLTVYPGRLEVPDQVLSDDDSYRIWGRKKVGTDFDVLATRGQYLIALECKERKTTTLRKTRLGNMMHRYMDELVLKGRWLAQNLVAVERVPEFHKTVGENAKVLLPILVYNFVVDEFGPPKQLLTFRELSYFLAKFDFSTTPNEDLTLELPIDVGRSVHATCVRIENSSK